MNGYHDRVLKLSPRQSKQPSTTVGRAGGGRCYLVVHVAPSGVTEREFSNYSEAEGFLHERRSTGLGGYIEILQGSKGNKAWEMVMRSDLVTKSASARTKRTPWDAAKKRQSTGRSVASVQAEIERLRKRR